MLRFKKIIFAASTINGTMHVFIFFVADQREICVKQKWQAPLIENNFFMYFILLSSTFFYALILFLRGSFKMYLSFYFQRYNRRK